MSEHDELDTDSQDHNASPDESGNDGAPSSRRRLMDRLMDAAPSAPARPGLDRNGNPTKWSIDRIDSRERVYCYLAGFMAAFFAVLIYVVESNNTHFHLKKGQFTPLTTLAVGLVCAVLLVGTTYLGRRALVGFVALFTFLGFSNSDFRVGLPFLLLAAWLLYRSFKVQKEITARIKADRPPGAKAATPSQSRADAVAVRRAGGRTGGRSKGPAVPQGNKRYTPKAATRPSPPPSKPSWRERRAAKAAD
jgi:hypothetical protein